MAVSARRTDGRFVEVATVVTGTTWRAVLLFSAADGGLWNVDVGTDGVGCRSQISVILPAGVVAPPTEQPGAGPLDTPADLFEGFDLRATVFEASALLVLASWIFLVVMVVAARSGARPLLRPRLRRAVQGAVFVAVLGGFMAAGFVIYFMDGIAHFDSGIPPSEEALLNAGLVAMGIVGSVLGTLAAWRLGERVVAGDT